ncbi:type II secretion system minor pseudopilin GspJ [Thalassomonas actiniarum]|uniref:Type II secretion system protein J n=1 Tax=Thalassomonas actiniarum TaxID=485447 RepID=A0AAE9YPK6_9GAMM|nr:type II secretion system minor pseudopilin GspJ [Thalassomonas actiniarum]WDD98885.1 type II secretion system minor pseudopilin GspJ [Thalassomonas actiniarum]
MKAFVNNRGFTLLEVLIAIAIFSVVSLSSFTIFDTVLSSEEASKTRTERMNELQRAFLLIERDLTQIARRSIRVNGEQPLDGYIHTDESSFFSETQAIGFVRNGWTNPGLLLPRSDMQSVAYQLNEETLERLHFNFVDAVPGEEPKVRPLISGVTSLKFNFFDGKEWQEELAKGTLPLAIAIEIELEDYGLVRRQYLVAGDVPEDSGPGDSSRGNSSRGKGSNNNGGNSTGGGNNSGGASKGSK